jgi:hypothetical protein
MMRIEFILTAFALPLSTPPRKRVNRLRDRRSAGSAPGTPVDRTLPSPASGQCHNNALLTVERLRNTLQQYATRSHHDAASGTCAVLHSSQPTKNRIQLVVSRS